VFVAISTYLVLLDDCTHYSCTFPLRYKFDTFSTFSHFTYVPHSFVAPSRVSSAIMVMSSMTPPTLSSSLTTSIPGCHVPTPLPRMARLSTWFTPPIISCAPYYSKLSSSSATGSWVATSWTSYPWKLLLHVYCSIFTMCVISIAFCSFYLGHLNLQHFMLIIVCNGCETSFSVWLLPVALCWRRRFHRCYTNTSVRTRKRA
jgi:hypothetical protein